MTLGVKEWLGHLLFPKVCAACKEAPVETELPLCSHCRNLLTIPDYPRCPKCGNPMDTILNVCHECLHVPDRPWSQGIAVLPYHGPAGELVKRYKFKKETSLIPILAWILAEGWKKYGIGYPDLLIPIPISYSRYMQRGFNQCELLAEHVSKLLNIPVDSTILRKRSRTKHQALLNQKERQKNIRHSFKVSSAKAHALAGKHILLLDDVLTTGATLAEATKTLQRYNTAVSIITITRG